MTNIHLTVQGAFAVAEKDGVLTAGMTGIPVTITYDSAWDGLTKTLICKGGGKPKAIIDVDGSATVAPEVMKSHYELYLGVEGRNADGTLVIPTIWACCGRILPSASVDVDPTADPTLPVWAQVKQELERVPQIINSALCDAKDSGEFDGRAGNGIESVECNDDYSVTLIMDDGTSYTTPSIRGATGADGKDGITPHIGENGNWFIGETDTGNPSRGIQGEPGADGYTPQKNVDYSDGQPGKDGTSPVVSVSAIEGGHRITITDVNGTKTVDVLDGSDGKDGQNGQNGNGIKSAVLNADYTLTLTFDDGTSYTTPSIRGATGETGSSGKDGNDGKDGVSVTHSWNGTTLTVTSASGTSSANLKGDKGDKGDPGETGPAGSDATVVVDSSLSSTSTNPVQNKVVTAKFNSLARRMSEVGWNGATDKVAYYEIGRMPAYNSGDNRGSVLLTGRLGHWIASSIANFSILLSNRSGCQASVFAQGNVTGALNCCDIEVYRQTDDTDIIYIKTKGYWVFDLEYVANQVTMQYKNVQVTPTGTKVWTLSEEKRVSTDFQGAMTANEFKGKFTATEDPTTAMGVATKQYVDNQISAKVAEQEDLVSAVLNALPTWTGGSY